VDRSADFYGPNNEKSFLIEVVYKNIRKGKTPNWFMDTDKNILSLILLILQRPLQF